MSTNPGFLVRKAGPLVVDRRAKGPPVLYYGENVIEAGKRAKIATDAAASAISSATIAVSQAGIATGAAGAAASSATVATGQASAATSSATLAAQHATAAGSSATVASGQATAAASSATVASGQASAATSSATVASAQASTATLQAAAATSSATLAGTRATAAGSSATVASGQATAAASSATVASAQASAANSSATVANAAYVNMQTLYLGPKASDPTTDNAGGALVNGAQYFNTTVGEMRVRYAGAWQAGYLPAGAYLAKSQNLADLQNVATARGNLLLGTAATMAGPAGAIVGTTDTQSLDSKTLNGATINGYTEGSASASGTSFSPNITADTVFYYTVTGNCTIALPAVQAEKSFTIVTIFTGAFTVAWAGGSRLWADGEVPEPTSANGKRDVYVFLSDETASNWMGSQAMANL